MRDNFQNDLKLILKNKWQKNVLLPPFLLPFWMLHLQNCIKFEIIILCFWFALRKVRQDQNPTLPFVLLFRKSCFVWFVIAFELINNRLCFGWRSRLRCAHRDKFDYNVSLCLWLVKHLSQIPPSLHSSG